MIYPIDINTRVKNKRKLAAGENLQQLVSVLFIVGNFIAFFFFNWLATSFLNSGFAMALGFTVLLDVIVFFFVFRFVLFDENAKISEYKNHEGDSFARYMNIRKDVQHTITSNRKKISVVEFADGSASCVFEFKFGSNDDQKAKGTEILLRKLLNAALTYNFEARCCIMSEDFGNSDEFRGYMKTVNNIESTKLKDAMVLLADQALKDSMARSNVDVVYLTIRSVSTYQRAELEAVVRNILVIISENYSAFRSIKSLDLNGLLEFYRKFYGISAIDLSMMKVIDLSSETQETFKKVASMYELISTDGTVYNSSSAKNIFELKEVKLK